MWRNRRSICVGIGLLAFAMFGLVLPAHAQSSNRISVFGGAGWMAGDPGQSGGGPSFRGAVLFPVMRTLRLEFDALRFNTTASGYGSTDQILVGGALLFEGPTGRRVRLVAAGGAGQVSYHERTAEGFVWRDGKTTALYADFGTIVTMSRHLLIRVDGIFWGGEETGAGGVNAAVGYRF